jgi:predicted nuclease of predicted toxin-antitoxin system
LIVWIDAQMSPELAGWIAANFGVEARSVRELGLLHAKDREIFLACREAGTVIMTKDSDFLDLLDRLGTPPQVLWITCGNTSNSHLRQILQHALPQALQWLDKGEPLVEISDAK